MIEENKLIYGILIILAGVAYLYTLLKSRKLDEGNSWDKSMSFRGIMGGICLILIGIVAILMHFDLW